jgi:VCBS repeat-containing protein
MNEGDTLTMSVPGVLDGSSDADGPGPITAAAVTSPQHGTLTLNADGSFVYTPNINYAGTDSFTYTAKDAQNAESAPATATITVGAL